MLLRLSDDPVVKAYVKTVLHQRGTLMAHSEFNILLLPIQRCSSYQGLNVFNRGHPHSDIRNQFGSVLT